MTHAAVVRRVLTVTAFVLAAANPGRAQEAVAGKWELNIDSPQGSTTAVLTLAVDGDAVKGSLASAAGETPIAGKVNGGQVTFSFDFNGPNGAMTITSKATVTGDDVKGEMDYGVGTVPFTGKRAAP